MQQADKATYLLNRFINSHERYQYKITAFEISILYILVRYLDMPKGICFLSQLNFANEAGMSKKEFQRRSEKMYENKLIFRYQRGKSYIYELGEAITGIKSE